MDKNKINKEKSADENHIILDFLTMVLQLFFC